MSAQTTLGAAHLRQLHNEPLVSLAVILHEGVTVCVQNGGALLGLSVAGHDLGPIFGQGKVVPVFLCAVCLFLLLLTLLL